MTDQIDQTRLEAALAELTLESFRRDWSSSGETEQDTRFQESLTREIATKIFENLGGGENPEDEDDAWDRAFSDEPALPEVQTYYDAINKIGIAVHTRWDSLAHESSRNGVSGNTPIRAELECTISTPSPSEIARYSRSCGLHGPQLSVHVYSSGLTVRCVDPKHDRTLISIIGPNEGRTEEIQKSLSFEQYRYIGASINDIQTALSEIERRIQAIVEELTNAPNVPVHLKMHTRIGH